MVLRAPKLGSEGVAEVKGRKRVWIVRGLWGGLVIQGLSRGIRGPQKWGYTAVIKAVERKPQRKAKERQGQQQDEE